MKRAGWMLTAVSATLALAIPAFGQGVKMEKVTFMGEPNCYRLTNGTIDVVVTTNIGPRVIRYGFVGGQNEFAELPDVTTPTTLGTWHIWGGHRLWHSPEAMPRSYSPDNSPIEWKKVGDNRIDLIEPVEPATGIQKEIDVTLDSTGTRVVVVHKLTNKGLWPVRLACWAMSAMHAGGRAIFPQEPFFSHTEKLGPSRPLVLWGYTNMADHRWTWGRLFIQFRNDPNVSEPQKFGIGNTLGWAAYERNHELFMVRFPYIEGAKYPDMGCDNESYTDNHFLELETLSPLVTLDPGKTVSYTEDWYLFKGVHLGDTDESIQRGIEPLVKETVPTPVAEAFIPPH